MDRVENVFTFIEGDVYNVQWLIEYTAQRLCAPNIAVTILMLKTFWTQHKVAQELDK